MSRKNHKYGFRSFFRKKALIPLTLMLLIFASVFVGCTSEGNGVGEIIDDLVGTVRVTLADVDGVTVISEKIVDVSFGESASFDIQLEDGVVIDSISHGVFESGTLTVRDVYMPTTVRIKTHRLVKCDFEAISSNETLGTIEMTHENGTYWEDSEVTITAKPIKDSVFVGFSAGVPYDEGGEILSTDFTYTHTLKSDVKIYANFSKPPKNDPALTIAVPQGQWVVLYHPNGGVRTENGSTNYLYSTFSNEYYYCPNTYPNTGLFEKEGHILLGYNTEPDGSGIFYAPGWNVIMPERGAISLYCVWAEVTPESKFAYTTLQDGTVSISRYTGDEERVVVPETLNGKKVTTINANAFKGKSMKELVISRTVTKVEDDAFANCTKLETLYFSDSVLQIKDEAFSGCSSLKTIHMMATRFPAYASSRNGTFSIKFEKLITAQKNKLILVSGSNTSFGVNSETLEKELLAAGHDYDIINYGTIAEETVVFILEVISHFVDEGDLVVHQPEVKSATQWGKNSFNDNYTWTVFECAYDAFSYVDMRFYTDFFDSFATFNQKRVKVTMVDYQRYTTDTVNRYGDYAAYRASTTSGLKEKFQNFKNKGQGNVDYDNVLEFLEEYGALLKRAYELVGNSGATMLNSFASTAKTYLTKESAIAGGADQKRLEAMVDLFPTTRISSISTYVFEDEWFYNSEYHLTSKGAIMRSELLAKDIIAYLKKVNK